MKKIIIFHNIVAPYRTELFNQLSKICHLKVVFFQRKDSTRLWEQTVDNFEFEYEFLDSKEIAFLGKKLYFNTGIFKTLKEFSPELVFVLDNPPNYLSSVLSSILSKILNIKTILWTGAYRQNLLNNSNSLKSKIMSCAIFLIRRLLVKLSHKYWCYSSETKSYLMNSFGVCEEDAIVGLQGYPSNLIHQQYTCIKRKYNSNKFLYLGYINERKGISDFLENALPILSKFGYEIDIVGDGEQKEYLEGKYSHKKNISFYPYSEGAAKAKYISEAKYMILPSKADPWGWVVQEASMLRTPILVSDKVMAKEINPINSLVYKLESECDIKIALEYLVNLNYDNYVSLCNKVEINAQHHTLTKSIDSFKKLVLDI